MNKSDLMTALKDKDDLSRQEAEKIVNVFFGSIEDSLCNGGVLRSGDSAVLRSTPTNPISAAIPKPATRSASQPKDFPFSKWEKNSRNLSIIKILGG